MKHEGKTRKGDGQEKSILIIAFRAPGFVIGIAFSVCTYLLI